MTREANRARFPWLATIKDRYGEDAKILWAQDEAGEIGKIPDDPPSWITIDAVKFGEMANLGDTMNPKRRAPRK